MKNKRTRKELKNGSVSEILRELTETHGPAGFEEKVRDIVRDRFALYVQDVHVDKLGNVIAYKAGSCAAPRSSIMIAAHMDEIALIVSHIEKGFLGIDGIGGVDPRVLLGQEVTVLGNQRLSGLIVSIPPHFTSQGERDRTIPIDKLFVDVGLAEDRVREIVRVGNPIVIKSPLLRMQKGRVAGKALDDRAGIAALLVCLEALENMKCRWDVYAVATVQEETAGGGAKTGTYHLTPTQAIAVDVTFGEQPGASEQETFKLDGGPTIAFGPNVHPKIYKRLVDVASELEIPYQIEPIPGHSGTDAWTMQVSRSGVPTGILGIPLRNMHTAVETVVLKDIERTGRLLAAYVSRLDDEFQKSFTWTSRQKQTEER